MRVSQTKEYKTAWHEKMKAMPFADKPHGTTKCYIHYGCHCDACLRAERNARKRRALAALDRRKHQEAINRESENHRLHHQAVLAEREKMNLVLTDMGGDDWLLVPDVQRNGERVFRRGRLVERESYIRSVWGVLKVDYANPILNEQSGA